jgi:hypothetical protein
MIQKMRDATPSTSSFAGCSRVLLPPLLLPNVVAYVYNGLVPMSTYMMPKLA